MGDGEFLFLGSEGLYQTLERLARERGLDRPTPVFEALLDDDRKRCASLSGAVLQ